LKVTVRARLAVKLFMVHTVNPGPEVESQPADQPPNVPLGAAVNITMVPLGKLVLQLVAQLRPAGELVTVPVPVPAKVTVRIGPEPVKHVTFAVMEPVTIAPDEDRPPLLLFVVFVAETRVFPQKSPVAVIRPVEVTVTICGVFEVQTTWSVMSLVTGGWI
jgi:hypothetical protein